MVCDPPIVHCTNVLPPPTVDWAGGAAYDPMRDVVWHTEGTRILEVDQNTCKSGCLVPATQALGATSRASGLTINPARREMYELETVPGFAAITTWSLSPVNCPQPRSTCRIPLPTTRHRAGAIAFDQKRDVIYVASSVFGGLTPNNVLLLYRRGDPNCQPFCRIPVSACATGQLQSIRAMAYDECKDQILISDGRQTSTQAVIWAAGASCPTLRPQSCCPLNHPRAEFWYGFDIRSITARSLGGSCLPSACPSCPSMSFDAVGAAVPGNGAFGFAFDNAPSGSTGFAFLNVGGCQPIPFLCGRFYPVVNGSLINIGPIPLGGAGACGGSGFAPVPLPNNFNLCNLLICAQGVVVCPSGGIGLTNAEVVPIGS